MEVNGVWVGWGLGDNSKVDLTVQKAKAYMRAEYRSYAGTLADTNVYDAQMVAVVTEMQNRLVAGGQLVAGGFMLGVLDLPTEYAMGFKKKNLPILFSVEGHMSDMFSGPVADTATQLEAEGRCHHEPTGYDNGKIPFDNASGVTELARRVGQTTQDNGVPFPAGTKFGLLTFSQGGIIGYDFWEQHMMPGCDLAWRAPDLLGILAYGDPCRATNSCAPWSVAQGSNNDGTHGLDPLKRWDLPGCCPRPANFMDVWRRGDIFSQNTTDLKGQLKASIYQAVARSDIVNFGSLLSAGEGAVTGGLLSKIPGGSLLSSLGVGNLLGGLGGGSVTSVDLASVLVSQLGDVASGDIPELITFAIGVIEAIFGGVVFLGDQPNPHYSPYDISGGVNWMRGLLQAA